LKQIEQALDTQEELKHGLSGLLQVVLFFFDIEAELEISIDGNMRAKITEFSHSGFKNIGGIFSDAHLMDFDEAKEFSEDILIDLLMNYKESQIHEILGAPVDP
jgi:hypothetical protein